MTTHPFDCGWYLPGSAIARALFAGVVVVLVVLVAYVIGYGDSAMITVGTAVLTTVVTDGCRAMLQLRWRAE
ncbi:hypothetical protein PV458_09730 [Streptomyces sp. MN03-5084-2B]|nr:hypothetical protein [Streptomyces sp. MN03-5084-2B]